MQRPIKTFLQLFEEKQIIFSDLSRIQQGIIISSYEKHN